MFQFLLFVQYLSIAVVAAEVIYIFIKWENKLQGLLLFSCIVTLINNVGYLMEMKAGNFDGYLTGLYISYVGRAFIPYALLLFTLYLSNVSLNKVISSVLASCHALTFVAVMTCKYQTLYYKQIEWIEDGLFYHIECQNGIWHAIYSVLIVTYIVVGLNALIRSALKEENPIARKRLWMVVLSVAVQSLFFIISIMDVTGCYDITFAGYTLGAIVMGIAIFKYDLLDTLELAREFIIDDIPEGVVVFDQNGKLEFANRIAKAVFDEVFSECGIQQFLEEHIGIDRQIENRDHIYSVDKKVLVHKEVERGTVYILVDDTERFHHMSELKKQVELAEEARAEAEAASASKSRFLSVVSHELRTPMNAVVGMVELMLRDSDKLDEKQKKYLENIQSSGKALVMIVNDILDQSKIESGKMELVEDNYELRPMLSDVMMIIENRIDTKPIKLQLELGEDVPRYLLGDSLRIRQILINLMNNAVKFTEKGYIRLIIECIQKGADKVSVKFCIKDTGQGIKEEDLCRLGEAFSQVDIKKNHGKEGTGLGLSISKDFINMMGGQLQVASVYGEGSEFYFTIEQGIVDQKQCEDASAIGQAWQEEEQFICPKAKVLLVDDTPFNLRILKEMVKPLNMKVDTASSGEEAIELIRDNQYQVVFMDYIMPYMNGVETTKKIRALAEEGDSNADYYRLLPIIALTGDSSDETKEEFFTAGINDFTEKPVNFMCIKKLLLAWLPEEYIEQE